MTCKEVPRVIDAYLDGELSVAATLQAHECFAACENCRRILESEAALHGLLVQEGRAEAAPEGSALTFSALSPRRGRREPGLPVGWP